MKTIDKYVQEYTQKKALQKEYKTHLREYNLELENLKQEKSNADRAVGVLKDASKDAIKALQIKLTNTVNYALADVFEEPPIFGIDFVERRNKIESDIYIQDAHGNKINPLENSAGGVVDIISLALQVTLWGLQNPRSRAVLVLDEPLKWLKGKEYPQKGAQLIQSLSKIANIQIIMVSHSPELIDCADNVIEVVQENDHSIIMQN